jgi:hypothetical protein
VIVHVLATLAACVAAGLADELLGKHLPLVPRLLLAAAVATPVLRFAHAHIKQLRADLGR